MDVIASASRHKPCFICLLRIYEGFKTIVLTSAFAFKSAQIASPISAFMIVSIVPAVFHNLAIVISMMLVWVEWAFLYNEGRAGIGIA